MENKLSSWYINRSLKYQIKQKSIGGESYRCIFMDLTMPIMDGYEAAKIINKQVNFVSIFFQIKMGEIPETLLIALSGHSDDKEKEKC